MLTTQASLMFDTLIRWVCLLLAKTSTPSLFHLLQFSTPASLGLLSFLPFLKYHSSLDHQLVLWNVSCHMRVPGLPLQARQDQLSFCYFLTHFHLLVSSLLRLFHLEPPFFVVPWSIHARSALCSYCTQSSVSSWLIPTLSRFGLVEPPSFPFSPSLLSCA